MKLKIISIVVAALFATVYSANAQNKQVKIESETELKNLEAVNRFLDIVLLEKNKGHGLTELLDADFKFDDPFVKASSARDFIERNQHWFAMEKTYKMKQQFAKENQIVSIYTVFLKVADNVTEIEIADHVEFRDGKMIKEKLYFDPSPQKQGNP